MKLSGWWFLLAGALVAGVSAVMVMRGAKFTLFLLAGVAMAVFGVLRLYLDRGVRAERERGRLERELPSSRPRNYSLSTIPRICSMCGTKNNPLANYCGHCGNRI
jgi:hypothetical protein